MTNLSGSKPIVLIMMLLPIVQSCAQIKSWLPPKRTVQASAPVQDMSQKSDQESAQAVNPAKKQTVKTSTPETDTSQTTNLKSNQAVYLAKKHMEAGDYQKAVDVYHAAYRENPHDRVVLRDYKKGIETIKAAADRAFDAGDFTSAGRNYNVLVETFRQIEGDLDKRLSFTSTYLNEKLSNCKNAVYKQGFQEYRKGNLKGAIARWEELLAFDPHNIDIKKTLRTAKLQQENLEEADSRH